MLMAELRHEDIIEIYGAATSLEADRIVLLLDEDGIEAIARAASMSSSFPSPAEAHFLVCVREPDKPKARALIEAARTDGAISTDGAFLD
jgi:hypothetical protein